MGFSADLRAFVQAFQAGYKLIPSQTDEEYKKAQTEYQKSLTEKLKWDQSPEMRALDLRERNAEVLKNEAYAKHYGSGAAGPRPRVGDLEVLTPEQQEELDKLEGRVPFDPEVTEDFAHGGMFTGRFQGNRPAMAGMGAIPMSFMQGFDFRQMMDPNAWRNQAMQWGNRMQGAVPMRPQRPEGQMRPAVTQQVTPGFAAPMDNDGARPKARKYGGAIPGVPQYADGGAVEETTPTGTGTLPQGFSLLAVEDAVKGGEEGINEMFGLNGAVGVPDGPRREEAKEKGVNAVDPKQLEEVDQAMGIQNMPEDRRNLARLAGVWEFYQKQGMPKRAKNAAGELLQTYKMIKNRYEAIAKQAAEEGDVEGAIDAAVRMYAWIPDGKSVKVRRAKDGKNYVYSYVDDKSGKEVHKQLMSPEEILQEITSYGMTGEEDLAYAADDKEEISAIAATKANKRKVEDDVRADNRSARSDNRRAMRDDPDKYTAKNPAKIESWEQFDQLPLGAYFVNPSTGDIVPKTKERTAPGG